MLRRLWLTAAAAAVLALLALPAAASAGVGTGADPSDAIVVLAGDVVIGPGQTVDGVFVGSGDVTIRGHVTGDVAVLSGEVLVTGRIDGDLVTISGETRIEGAEIGGDVVYADEHPDVSADTLVGGRVEEMQWPDLGGGALSLIGGLILWLAISVSLAVLGALLILIAPRAADAIAARSRERAGPTIAIGIAISIALPVAGFIAAITLLGLPLAIGLALAMLPLGAVAYCASAYALGRRLLGPARERILAFLAGLGILQAASLVPFLDLVVFIAATVFGLGLIGAAIGAARNPDAARSQGT